jgi:hypothetical protein
MKLIIVNIKIKFGIFLNKEYFNIFISISGSYLKYLPSLPHLDSSFLQELA